MYAEEECLKEAGVQVAFSTGLQSSRTAKDVDHSKDEIGQQVTTNYEDDKSRPRHGQQRVIGSEAAPESSFAADVEAAIAIQQAQPLLLRHDAAKAEITIGLFLRGCAPAVSGHMR